MEGEHFVALLGVDLGSSSLKAALVDAATGRLILRAVDYDEDWFGPQPDHLERSPETYWRAFLQIVRDLNVPPQSIEAVSFSVQGETFVVADKDGRPLRKAIQGHDVRAHQEPALLLDRFGAARLHAASGQPSVDAYWIAAKLLWLKRHEPEVFRGIRRLFTLDGYLIHKLTGRAVVEKSLIGNSYLYDMSAEAWFEEMFDFLGLAPSIMPELVRAGELVGVVSRKAAAQTGLAPGTPVFAGALDQIAAALAAGNVRPGIVTETTGTALALGVTVTGRLADCLKTGLPVFYHAVPDGLFLMPWLGSGGYTLQWFRDNFAPGESYDELTAAAAEIPPGAEGLTMLPFLSGANCPEFDTSARGVFFGIAPGHTKSHFARAILEALAYAIRANLDLLRSGGIEARELRSMGNVARSAVWTQIKADVCGLPIRPLKVVDAASLGAAVLAGAPACVVEMGEAVEPDPRNRGVYDKGFGKYRELYQRLKGCF